MGRTTILLALALAVSVAGEGRGDACSCGGGVDVVSPAPGATVPPNVVIVARAYSGLLTATITSGSGESIPVDVDPTSRPFSSDSTYRIRPLLPLAPGDYTATIELSNQVTTVAFTVVGVVDDVGPAGFSGIEEVTLESIRETSCSNSCVRVFCPLGSVCFIPRVAVAFTESPEAAWYDVEVRREEETAPFDSFVFRPGEPHMLSMQLCGSPVTPPVAPGEAYCVKVLARDAAENGTGGGVEICQTTAECAPDFDNQCLPLPGCPAPPDAGPAAADAGADPAVDGDGAGCGCGVGGRSRPSSMALWLVALVVASSRARRGQL